MDIRFRYGGPSKQPREPEASPAQRCDVRNPEGINGATVDAALKARFQAVCFALESCESPEESQPLLERIFADIFDGAIAGDSRLLHMLSGQLLWEM